jgi:hypothetical protein
VRENKDILKTLEEFITPIKSRIEKRDSFQVLKEAILLSFEK